MHDYFLYDTEIIRLALVFGIVISLFAYNQFGVTTGGVITPGYLGLFIIQPSHVLVTLLLATGTYYLVHKILRPRIMLWGRRLFEYEILITLVLQLMWIGVLGFSKNFVSEVSLFYGIGFLIPGIIAHDMGRQGGRKTMIATVLSAVAVFSLVIMTGVLRTALPTQALFNFTNVSSDLPSLTFPPRLLYIGIILSVIVNIFLYRGKIVTVLRSGGFVSAAYLAMMLSRPVDILLIVFGSTATYLIVTRILTKRTLIFGRNKMAVMVLVGMLITWFLELGAHFLWQYQPWAGFNVIPPMIIALLANDAERQTPRHTLLGAGLATLIVFITLVWF